MKLTDSACRNAKPRLKPFKMSDGHGLYLHVMPNGSKVWRHKCFHLGKEVLLTYGGYDVLSLAEARRMRDQSRNLLLNGVNPSIAKKQDKLKAAKQERDTFKAVGLEWFETQRPEWSEDHAEGVLKRLNQDLFPTLGERPIREVTPSDLLETLRKIEKRGAFYTAGRARALAGSIFRHGRITGKCTHDPATDLRGALKSKKAVHFASLDKKQLPKFIASIASNEPRLFGRTIRAIKLSMLTFQRPGEIRQARWDEIDFERGLWIIPAEKMKMRRSHIVPLSRQAIDILRQQQDETDLLTSPWVFPSQIKPIKPMSDGTVNCALKRLGFSQIMTAHGFRALARTTIREDLKIDADVIERQLAHKASGPLGEAYDRAQFIDQRIIMMQGWADYLDTFSPNNNVFPINYRKAG